MDKYIYDDKNGLWYELQGDYSIPFLDFNNSFKRKQYCQDFQNDLREELCRLYIRR